jgi:Zn-dependent M16 (insulinase) family peptidase
LLSLKSIESSYVVQAVAAPPHFLHEDDAALRVLSELLTTTEGVFWKRIRGLGLAYGYGITMYIELGAVLFTLYRSSQFIKAYEGSYYYYFFSLFSFLCFLFNRESSNH